jgi:hypothetical protein
MPVSMTSLALELDGEYVLGVGEKGQLAPAIHDALCRDIGEPHVGQDHDDAMVYLPAFARQDERFACAARLRDHLVRDDSRAVELAVRPGNQRFRPDLEHVFRNASEPVGFPGCEADGGCHSAILAES